MTLVYANIAISWQLLRFNSLKKHFPQIYRFRRFENGLGKKFPDLKFFSLILAEKTLFFPDFPDWKKSSEISLNSLIGGNPAQANFRPNLGPTSGQTSGQLRAKPRANFGPNFGPTLVSKYAIHLALPNFHLKMLKTHSWSQFLTDCHIWPTKLKLRTSSTRKKIVWWCLYGHKGPKNGKKCWHWQFLAHFLPCLGPLQAIKHHQTIFFL